MLSSFQYHLYSLFMIETSIQYSETLNMKTGKTPKAKQVLRKIHHKNNKHSQTER